MVAKIVFLFPATVILCSVLLFSACDPILDTVPATKIVITAAGGSTSIETDGGTLQMLTEKTPASSNTDVSWYVTYRTGMASVSETGLVTAQAEGTVEITAKAGSVVSNTITLTIGPQTPGWKRFGPVVDGSKIYSSLNIAIDAEGTVYRAYIEERAYAEYDAVVSFFDGTGWTRLGGIANDPSRVVTGIDLALDPDGTPYVVCAYRTNTYHMAIQVRRWNGASWENFGEEITTYLNGDLTIAVAMDRTVYLGWNGLPITMMRFNAGAWDNFFTNFSDDYVSNVNFVSMAIAPDSSVYMLLGDYHDDLWAGRYTGTGWTVLGGDEVVHYTISNHAMVACDPNGVPYIVYSDDIDVGLSVRKYVEPNWVLVGSERFTQYGLAPCLRINGSGTPYVAQLGDYITIHRFDGIGWTKIGEIDSGADYFSSLNLVFNDDDTPFIAYIDHIAGSYDTAAIVMLYR